jgi:hypothetical protein
MADADDVRRLALALPHVEEIDSDGFDFRVGGKGFVWSYPERRPGQPRVIRTDIAVLYVGDEAEKQALLLGEPGAFFTAPGYDGWPLVLLRLAEVDAGRLAELVTDAWRMRAPHEFATGFDEDGSGLGEAGAAGDQPATSAASRAPSSQQASRSALPGGPATVTGGRTGRHCRPVVTDSTARTAPPVSLPPCTYRP